MAQRNQAEVKAAAKEIRNYLKGRPMTAGNVQGALTKVWKDSDYDTGLMEAAYDAYRAKHGTPRI